MEASKTMKNKRKVALKAGKTITRFSFSPFRRNQLRWALHCYRWRKDIKWRNYSYEIRSALKMKDDEKGINEKDPFNWLIGGIEPKPEKLLLFEKFIRKVAPEYEKNFTEQDYYVQAANFFSHFDGDSLIDIDQQTALENELEGLSQQAQAIENLSFAIVDDKMGAVPVITFRQLGKTPCLLAYFFLLYKPKGEDFKDFEKNPPADIDLRNDYMDYLLEINQEQIAECHIGVVTPNKYGQRYIGMLRSMHNMPALMNSTVLSIGKITEPYSGYLTEKDDWHEMGMNPAIIFYPESNFLGLKKPDTYPGTVKFVATGTVRTAIAFKNNHLQNVVSQMKEPIAW